MSSINPYFTFNYSQPDEYQFSHDSVFLARRVFELERDQDIKSLEVLDLCAGCGIIGMDFVFHCEKELNIFPTRVDFLEVQSVYQPHFLKNAKNIPTASLHFLNQNYDDLINNMAPKYDLIVSNPPYFLSSHGKLSPSEFKNRCRFFIDSSLHSLIAAIDSSLKPHGRAYVLIKESESHNYFPIRELQQAFSETLIMSALETIRGTPLILITKK